MDDLTNWHPLYQELAWLLGREAALKLHDQFGGAQVTFPKRILAKSAEYQLIYTESQRGSSVMQLAHAHQYSEKSIRRILAKFKE